MLEQPNAKEFFRAQFGVAEKDLEHYLGLALSRGGDYADLYFEYRTTSSVHLEESIVKTATRGISVGVGIRVLSGEKTGYAYSDDLSRDKIERSALTAAHIAASAGRTVSVGISGSIAGHNLYPVEHPTIDLDVSQKIALVRTHPRKDRVPNRRPWLVQVVAQPRHRTVVFGLKTVCNLFPF